MAKTKAQKRFKAGVGSFVVMTRAGRYRLKDGRHKYRFYGPRVTTGRIVGFGKGGLSVRVLRDGYKTANDYWYLFWKPVANILYLSYDNQTSLYKLWHNKPRLQGHDGYYLPEGCIAAFCKDRFESVTGIKYSRYGAHCQRVTVGINSI